LQRRVFRKPPARHSHAAARVGSSVIIVGGKGKGKTVYSDCWSYNVDHKRWTNLGGSNLLAKGRGLSNHTLTRIGTQLVVIGGKTLHSVSSDVWVSNTVCLPLTAHVIDYGEIHVFEKVGSGHFSKVNRGEYRGMEVAVKKLRTKVYRKDKDKILRAFKQEISLLRELKHHNVIGMIGICTKPKCIVTEFLDNGSLHDFLRKPTCVVDIHLQTQFAMDIALGMNYLHSMKIIHRDLKSHNLLLDKNYNVKIGDLGISRIATTTQTMTSVGSVAWTAPEVLRKSHYNEKVDVYSYGVVLWEILSGAEPYEGLGRVEAAISVVTTGRRPAMQPEWDASWQNLMSWCWQESPTQRPSFAEVLDFLAQHY